MALLLRSSKIVESVYTKCLRTISLSTFQLQTQRLVSPASIDEFDHGMRKLNTILKGRRGVSKVDMEEIVTVLDKRDSISFTDSLNLLKACKNLYPAESTEVSRDVIAQVWNAINKCYDSSLDISHFNAFLQACIEIKHPLSIDDFLDDLKTNNLEPNRVTFQLIVHKYCQDGNTEEASKYVSIMKDKNLQVNLDVFNSFILGYSKIGDMKAAEDIITLITQSGLEPSYRTYMQLVNGYAVKGDLGEIKSISEKCQLTMSIDDHLTVVYHLFANGHDDSAINYLSENMRTNLNKPNSFQKILLNLLEVGKEDAALKMINFMADWNMFPDMNLEITGPFMKKLYSLKKPLEDILSICYTLTKQGWSKFHTEALLEEVLLNQNFEAAKIIIKRIKDENLGELRQEFYLPFIVHYGKTKNEEELKNLVTEISEQDFECDDNLLRLLIKALENIGVTSDGLAESLEEMKVNRFELGNNLPTYYLPKRQLKEMADIYQNMKLLYPYRLLDRTIKTFMNNTEEVKSLVTLINCSLGYESSDECIAKNEITVNRFFSHLLRHTKDEKLITDILQEMDRIKFGIPDDSRKMIQDDLPQFEEEEKAMLLSKISSLKCLRRYSNTQRNQGDTQQWMMSRKEQDLPYDRIYFNVMQNALQNEDCALLTELLKDPHADMLNVGVLSKVAVMFSGDGLVDDLNTTLSLMKKTNPTAHLHLGLVIRIVRNLLYKEKVSDAFNFLRNNLLNISEYEENLQRIQILLKELGDDSARLTPDQLEEMGAIFMEKSFPSKFKNSEIKSLINSGDLKEAVATFIELCKEERRVAARHDLQCALIEKQETDLLQDVLEACIGVTGELKAFHDLAVSFICCGRKLQAEKLFKSSGMQADNYTLEIHLKYLLRLKNIQALEDLADVTKDLFNCDRSMVLKYLLEGYVVDNNTEKVKEMWTSMQQEEYISDRLVKKIESFLNTGGEETPFQTHKELTTLKTNYKELVEEVFVEDKQFFEVIKDVKMKLMNNVQSQRSIPIFKIFLHLLYLNKDFETLNHISDMYEGSVDKMVKRRLTSLYIQDGHQDEILTKLEHEVMSPTNYNKFITIVNADLILSVLDKPDLINKVETICERLATLGHNDAYASYFTALLISGKDERADEIWQSKLKNTESVGIKHLSNVCIKNSTPEPLELLIKITEGSDTIQNRMSKIYEHLITIHVDNEDLQKAKDIYKIHGKELSLNNNIIEKLQ